MNTIHRGFIPLALLLLGLLVSGGIATATIYVQNHNKDINVPTSKDGVPEEASPEAPDSAQVTSSSPTEAYVVPGSTEIKIEPTVSSETEEICSKAAQITGTEKPSLNQQLQVLCDQLAEPALDTQEQRERWSELEENLKDKWDLYISIQASQESSENRAENINSKTP